eukprot:scaffold125981_cov28-Tisochrysis_lutea.AAC.5
MLEKRWLFSGNGRCASNPCQASSSSISGSVCRAHPANLGWPEAEYCECGGLPMPGDWRPSRSA